LTVRRRRAAVAVALLLLVVVAAVLLARRPTKAQSVSPQQATAAARQACAAIEDLEQLVLRNARLDEVRRARQPAAGADDTAARGDARWQALDGGVKSLRIGIEANDGRATRVGIDVVRAECRRVD
jgi:hypothetical protein